MGNLFSSSSSSSSKSETEIRVGMLGLDNAGKTTILYKLKHNETAHHASVVPTIGFNVETIHFGKYKLNIWDVGGNQPRTRVLWQHYNASVRVIIFVIDAADQQRLHEVIDELRWLWLREELSKAVFLIFANKQDLPNALSAEDLVRVLELPMLEHRWTVQECCALSGDGLWEGMQQVEKMLAATTNKLHKQFLMCK